MNKKDLFAAVDKQKNDLLRMGTIYATILK